MGRPLLVSVSGLDPGPVHSMLIDVESIECRRKKVSSSAIHKRFIGQCGVGGVDVSAIGRLSHVRWLTIPTSDVHVVQHALNHISQETS